MTAKLVVVVKSFSTHRAHAASRYPTEPMNLFFVLPVEVLRIEIFATDQTH